MHLHRRAFASLRPHFLAVGTMACACICAITLISCASAEQQAQGSESEPASVIVMDTPGSQPGHEDTSTLSENQKEKEELAYQQQLEEARSKLALSEDYRESFVHGDKPAEYQRYIVLHDTEGYGSAADVINSWDSNGNLVAAHFVVNKDGTVMQCVPLDKIAHHAGFGDAGHNELYGVEDESRDDKLGTVPIGDWAPDYGMNSYSIGIEMVHATDDGSYPEEQLVAVDNLIAYIDAYYGFESTIIDHKAWRSGNSDTSVAFAPYLANYQDHRTHD